MKKIVIVFFLFVATGMQTVYCATGTFLTDFISTSDWKRGKVSVDGTVLSFNGVSADGVADIIFGTTKNGQTILAISKNNKIIQSIELPALYYISVKQIRQSDTGKYFYIFSLAYDTSFARNMVMGYRNDEWCIYVDENDFYNPIQGDISKLDLENGRLRLIYTTYGVRVPKQIYEFGYNTVKRQLDYVDKGIVYK